MNPIIAKKTLLAIANYFKNNSVVMQFIPIFLILAYSTYRHEFTKLSHSILGKLFAVMLILYYTRMDFVYGTVCCAVVIWYYQQTEMEGFELKEKKEDKEKKDDFVDDGTNLPMEEESTLLEESPSLEGFETSVITIDQFNTAKDEFIKEKCKNGILMYKDFPVKSEMADHVYSEIKYNGKNKCNPCDRTCDYNIIEAKIETEKKLMPKTSNDLFGAFKQFFGTSEPFVPNSEQKNYGKL
jgi:hypothetical protein